MKAIPKAVRIAALRARLAALDAWLVSELNVPDDNLMKTWPGQRVYPSLESGLDDCEAEHRAVLYSRDVIRVRDALKPGSGWSAVVKAILVLRDFRAGRPA